MLSNISAWLKLSERVVATHQKRAKSDRKEEMVIFIWGQGCSHPSCPLGRAQLEEGRSQRKAERIPHPPQIRKHPEEDPNSRNLSPSFLSKTGPGYNS